MAIANEMDKGWDAGCILYLLIICIYILPKIHLFSEWTPKDGGRRLRFTNKKKIVRACKATIHTSYFLSWDIKVVTRM